MLEVKNISKYYGNKAALKNVSLNFKENTIYGILGRNGAGKTTLINIISNRIFPTFGEVLLNGSNVKENSKIQERIFCVTEKSNYPGDLKVKQGFYWTKEFHEGFDMEYACSLAAKFDLNTDKRIRALSTGYQSIFKLILALSGDANVIILDEPVLGLDASFRKLFYEELIQNYIEKPRTIILSTHLIDEVSDILEEVIIVDKGEVLISEPVETVLKTIYKVSGSVSNVDSYIKEISQETSGSKKALIGFENIGTFKVATIYGARTKIDEELVDKFNLEITKAKLQDLFIAITAKVKVKE